MSIVLPAPPPVQTDLLGLVLAYQVHKPMQCFEYNFEYNVSVGPNFFFQVWSSGDWMQVRAQGAVDSLFHFLQFVDNVTVTDFSDRFRFGARATYTRSNMSGGIGAVWSF